MQQPAIDILNANRIMTIATVRPDGWPQATIVGYANEGWSLYFLIYRDSQKFANIARDDRVAVTVGCEPSDIRQIKAVYAGLRRTKSPTSPSAAAPGTCSPSGTRT